MFAAGSQGSVIQSCIMGTPESPAERWDFQKYVRFGR